MPEIRKQLIGKILRPGQRPENARFIGNFLENAWNTRAKSLSETRNSTTTLADDAELLVGLDSTSLYVFRIALFFDTSATPDFRFAITGPSSPTEVVIRGHYVAVGDVNDTDFVDTTLGVSHSVTGTGGTTGGFVLIDARLETGANAGSLIVQWAQDTSDAADTTLLSGSYIDWMQVGGNTEDR